MTYAPVCVKAARTYLIGRGLDPAAIGIVGDPAHKATGGYHCGNDWLSDASRLTTDYSKRESSRDRPGTDAAMALDVGGLSAAELYKLSRFIVDACIRGEAWTQDIREVIYYDLPTGTVRRWDRLGVRSTGDSSHQWHTHISYHRDSEGRDKTELFRRYYEGSTTGDALMALSDADADALKYRVAALVQGSDDVLGSAIAGEDNFMARKLKAMDAKVDSLAAKVDALTARPQVQPAPVDAAALRDALTDPVVLAALVEASRQGANQAEDS